MKRVLACLGAMLCVVSATPDLDATTPVVLGVDGGSFTINNTPTFLVFVSYFDGLDVSDANLRIDFAWLKSKRVDGIRVFPNWWNKSGTTTRYSESSLITDDGALDSARVARLRRLLGIAQSHGLVVDLSVSGENVKKCAGAGCATASPFVPEGTLTKDELRSALVALTRELRRGRFSNVLIDIQNEADYNSLFVPPSSRATLTGADIRTIADAIHAINPTQLVTASLSGGSTALDAVSATVAGGLDALAWHETRAPEWWTLTSARVTAMREANRTPVYLQEPQPSNEAGWSVAGASDGLRAAIASGAAAWTFHTRSSFALNGTSLKAIVAADKNANDREFLAVLSTTKK